MPSLLLKKALKEITILYGLRVIRFWFALLFHDSKLFVLSETGEGNVFGVVRKSLLKFFMFLEKANIVQTS